MMQMIEANWPVVAVAVVVVVLLVWWLMARRSRASGERHHARDVLDEGVGPAQRNQALIDAPRAADIVPTPAAGAMAGVAEVVAMAAQEEVAQASASEAAAGDDLTRIKGLGPKLAALLASLGITRFEQIAGWSGDDLARVDAQLGAFQGRPQRDGWIEQARLLASGDTAGYEAKFGKL